MLIAPKSYVLTHPPLRLQIHGDAGVFVPDESHPPARHGDHDVKTHRVDGIHQIFPQRPAVVVASGDLHVAECQGRTALWGKQIYTFNKFAYLIVWPQNICYLDKFWKSSRLSEAVK